MKRILAFALVLLLLVGAGFWLKTKGGKGKVILDVDIAPPATHEAALYEISILIEENKDDMQSAVLALRGELRQTRQSETEFVSSWKRLDELAVMNKASDPATLAGMLNKPMLSVFGETGQGFSHYLPADFPLSFQFFQVGMLHKFFVPFLGETLREGNFSLEERDELGAYQADYKIAKTQDRYTLNKILRTYSHGHVSFDDQLHSIDYLLAADGRLLSAEGLFAQIFQANKARYRTQISIRLRDTESITEPALLTRENLKKIDFKELADASAAPAEAQRMSFAEAMTQIETVTMATDPKDVAKIFSALTVAVAEDPVQLQEVFDRILKTSARDDATQRRLSVLFGVLAQSESPTVAESLVDFVKQCPDNFCKLQALIAVSDTPNPSEAAAQKMFDLARSPDQDVAGTALLSVGSVGRKLSNSLPDLPGRLMSELNDPNRESLRSTVLAAMGNHGSPSYLPTLQTYAKDKDYRLQKSAFYSMRYLPQEGVNRILLDALEQPYIRSVKSEIFKALEFRKLSSDDNQVLAKRALTTADRELQLLAARNLVETYRSQPEQAEQALRLLREGSQLPDVKDYIESEMKQIQESRQPMTP